MKNKICFKCNNNKKIKYFYEGRNKCKICFIKDVSENYKNNAAYYKLYKANRYKIAEVNKRIKKYRSSAFYKEVQKRSKIKYLKNNPEKYRAKYIFNYAKRSGKIKPRPCEVCRSIKNIHGHHEDYSKPLEVKWLCSRHHEEAHATIRVNK